LKLQVTVGGKTYEVEVEVLEDDESPRPAQYGSYQQAPAASHPLPVQDSSHSSEQQDEGKFCLSPVMGLAIKVHVQPGQKVEANDLIMVLEAMKMETNITAPHAGVVNKVHVAEGDSVKLNQVLVEFE
jgi:methylmalonyl-CoA carboxyltransferase small subunit